MVLMAGSGDCSQGSMRRQTINEAFAYLKEVKKTFSDKKEKYDEFVKVMNAYKAQRIDTINVIERVKELFKGYPNLILGFNTFLPKGLEITLPPENEQALAKAANNVTEVFRFIMKVKLRFKGDDNVYKSFLSIMKSFKEEKKAISEVYDELSFLFRDHEDLLEKFTHFLPNPSGPIDTDRKDHKFTVTVESGKPKVIRDQRRQLDKDRDRVEDAVADHVDENQCPCEVSSDEIDLKTVYRKEFAFCKKVAERLRCEDYLNFLQCLHTYSREIISKHELHSQVHDILGKYSDLSEGFAEFLIHCEKNGFLGSVMSNKSMPEPLCSVILIDRDIGRDHGKEVRVGDSDTTEMDGTDITGLDVSEEATNLSIKPNVCGSHSSA